MVSFGRRKALIFSSSQEDSIAFLYKLSATIDVGIHPSLIAALFLVHIGNDKVKGYACIFINDKGTGDEQGKVPTFLGGTSIAVFLRR